MRRLSGVIYTLPHVMSFRPALIWNATVNVNLLSDRRAGKFYVFLCEVIGCADVSWWNKKTRTVL